MSRLVERYETVKELLPAKDEQEVKIAEMYVYPLRSVRAGPVDELEVGRYGIKYDREIVLAEAASKKIVKCNLHHPMACLSQVLRGSKVEISTSRPELLSAQGLPAKLTLDMDVDAEAELGAYVELHRNQSKDQFGGYTYPEDVCRWFSVAIGKEVIAVKAALKR